MRVVVLGSKYALNHLQQIERFKNKKESERMYNKNDINLLNEMNRLNCKFKAVRIEYIKPKEPTRIEKIRDLIGGL